MQSPEAFLIVFTQRAVEATSSDEPQTPRVSVTIVRNTSVGTWKPESGYEETQGHLKKSQALEGCSLENASGQRALCPQKDRLGTRGY